MDICCQETGFWAAKTLIFEGILVARLCNGVVFQNVATTFSDSTFFRSIMGLFGTLLCDFVKFLQLKMLLSHGGWVPLTSNNVNVINILHSERSRSAFTVHRTQNLKKW